MEIFSLEPVLPDIGAGEGVKAFIRGMGLITGVFLDTDNNIRKGSCLDVAHKEGETKGDEVGKLHSEEVLGLCVRVKSVVLDVKRMEVECGVSTTWRGT